MNITMKAIEETGFVDQSRRLQLDRPLPIDGPRRVRVIVLYAADGDLDESEWLRAAASNPAFASLNEPHENIYSLADGKPFSSSTTK